MRFAPPNPLRIADRASGLNALSVRSYNERLVLSLMLQNEATTRLEIAEKTGLSAQTVSVIIRSLEQEGLVAKGIAQRGRVGPPTTPLLLNPEGAFSIGVSIGYRGTHVVLIDFVGNVRKQILLPHEPGKLRLHPGIVENIKQAIDGLTPEDRQRVAGVGFALPSDVEIEGVDTDASAHPFEGLHRIMEKELDLPVFVQNDIAAAAAGESLFGVARTLSDYLFFYVGARLHSRLILNHQIYNSNSPKTIDAGILELERNLANSAETSSALWTPGVAWPDLGVPLLDWQKRCAEVITHSVEALAQFVEIRTVVLSSIAPQSVSNDICNALTAKLPGIEAKIGRNQPTPKAIGAASLPFSSRFMVEAAK